MTRHIQKKSLRTCAASLLGASLLAVATIGLASASLTSSAFAQEERRQFSAAVGEKVNEALTLANSGQTSSAINILQSTITQPDLNAFERSTIYQMLGQYSYELDRAVQAQQNFENAINAGGLLPNEADNIRIVIAQLMIGNGQYREGATRLKNYLNSGGQQKPQYIDLLINEWGQSEDYNRALPWAEKWFNAANPKERRHFDLLNFLFNNLGMKDRQADIVKEMINRWPEDKSLWDAWVFILSDGGNEQDAFEVKKIMYASGMLSEEQELLQLAQDYSSYDLPYQAAEILEREMHAKRVETTSERLQQTARLYRKAREYERALPFLHASATQSNDANIHLELGEALISVGQCESGKKCTKG